MSFKPDYVSMLLIHNAIFYLDVKKKKKNCLDGNWDIDDDIDHRLLTWTGCIWALVRASGHLFVCGNGNFFKFGLRFLV